MDTATLATALDRIRETQLQQDQTLATIARRQATVMRMLRDMDRRDKDTLTAWLDFLRPIAYATALWATGLLVIAYVLQGGNILTVLQMLRLLI